MRGCVRKSESRGEVEVVGGEQTAAVIFPQGA